MALGNWWEYRIQEENVFTDSTVNEPTFDLFNDDFESTHVWAVTAEELVQGRIAYRVEVTETIWTGFQKGNVNSGVFWISVSGDSLLHVGSEGIGRFRTIMSLKPVSRALQEPLSLLYLFPIKLADRWAVAPDDYFDTIRTVQAREFVTVPAGRFESLRLEETPVERSPAIWIYRRWLGAVGMVRAIYEFGGEEVRSDESGSVVGEFFTKTSGVVELVNYSIE